MLIVSVVVVFATPASTSYPIGDMWLPTRHVQVDNTTCGFFDFFLSPEKIK